MRVTTVELNVTVLVLGRVVEQAAPRVRVAGLDTSTGCS